MLVHNKAHNSSDIFPLNLQTIITVQMLSTGWHSGRVVKKQLKLNATL